MKISFRKTSNTHHELVVERADGSCERMDCETRSLLDHDLIHLAVEAEAGLNDGFWGSLASGLTFDQLSGASAAGLDDAQLAGLDAAEKLVGIMTGIGTSDVTAAVIEHASSYLQQVGGSVPECFGEDFVRNVAERLRRLRGHWRATNFGDAMVVEWTGSG